MSGVARYAERRTTRFLQSPPSLRLAANAIVTVTCFVVVGSGVLMRLLDHHEYGNVWVGMWWALQTVTTVGYGDVTPQHLAGRIIAAVVMLQGIAFVTIVVAAVTSTFVARATKDRGIAQDEAEARIEAKVDTIDERLARLEGMLGK